MDTAENKTDELLYLGIDGGATGTDFALEDSGGTLLRQLRLPPSNPFDLGIDRSLEVLRQGIDEILTGFPAENICMFAGLSGGRSGGNRALFTEFFSGFSFRAFDCDSDTANAVAVGLKGKDGVVSIIGTGNSTCVSMGGRLDFIGGHGYLFDKGLSGYDLGLSALKETFLARDGVTGGGILTALVNERCGGDIASSLKDFYSGTAKAYIASFCPLVFEAYGKGDPAAERIIRESALSLSGYILTALKRLPEEDRRAVLAGGMTRYESVLDPVLRSCPGMEDINLGFCREKPIKGSLFLARRLENNKETLT